MSRASVRLPKRALALAAIALAALLMSRVSAWAAPILHEHFVPEPAEDLEMGATTPSGSLPAALDTRSGVVAAPDETAPAPGGGQVYGGASTPNSPDATYQVDRLTTRPERVEYDEPFRPSILPFKRLYAFDRLQTDLSFAVRDKSLDEVPVGGNVQDFEDAFFADFEVDLVDGVPVRIPSVGPGARIRALHVDPPGPLKVVRDSAENWFVVAPRTGRARLMMQLTVDRRALGGEVVIESWSALREQLPEFPASARAEAHQVAEHIGVSRALPPTQALSRLVDYFRHFRESDELPQAQQTSQLYVELAFDQKGVCRHRAYAFAVTALHLGIPTRVVHNEAHAWVEVHDGALWHRIDLGGAATRLNQTRAQRDVPQHRPPSDPYSWPSRSHPAEALAPRRATSAPASLGDPSSRSATRANSPSPDPAAARSRSALRADPGSTSAGQDSSDDGLRITLRIDPSSLRRGQSLRVGGRATRDGRACRLSRLDFFLVGEGLAKAQDSSDVQGLSRGQDLSGVQGLSSGQGRSSGQGLGAALPVGSVATDRSGYFSGPLTIPRDVPVGKLSLEPRLGGGCP